MNEIELEIEMAGNGFVYFSVVGRPELGYVTLTGQLCNALGMLIGGKVAFSDVT